MKRLFQRFNPQDPITPKSPGRKNTTTFICIAFLIFSIGLVGWVAGVESYLWAAGGNIIVSSGDHIERLPLSARIMGLLLLGIGIFSGFWIIWGNRKIHIGILVPLVLIMGFVTLQNGRMAVNSTAGAGIHYGYAPFLLERIGFLYDGEPSEQDKRLGRIKIVSVEETKSEYIYHRLDTTDYAIKKGVLIWKLSPLSDFFY